MKATANDWGRFNVNVLRHPKLLGLPPRVIVAYFGAILWSVEHETDGRVPAEIFRPRGDVRVLVDRRLIDEDDDGLWIHDYADYQVTHEEREAEREKARERQARWREQQAQRREAEGSTEVTPGVTRDVTRDKTRDPSSSTSTSVVRGVGGSGGKGGDPFDRFWEAYPRHEGKRKARTAFASACRRAGPPEIIAAAERLRDDPNLPDKRFIPHPTTWLNRDGWEDDPLPARSKAGNARQLMDRARQLRAVEDATE